MPVLERVQVQAKAKGQTLEFGLPPTLPEIAIDGHRSPGFFKPGSNAIKFTPQGGTIRVSASQRSHGIRVCVSDTGQGIPQEYLSKIFDRFWRPPETNQAGTGLGLSIAKGIVQAQADTWG